MVATVGEAAAREVDWEQRLGELGLVLPAPLPSQALYRSVTRLRECLYVAGQGPFEGVGKPRYLGVLGEDVSIEQGQAAARLAALNFLSVVRSHLSTLAPVAQVLKMTVYVRSAAGFGMEHVVADGASEVFMEIGGPRGLGARTAIGVSDLPFGICVELDGVVALEGAAACGHAAAVGDA